MIPKCAVLRQILINTDNVNQQADFHPNKNQLFQYFYSGCQKNVAVFKRFFLQPYNRLCRNSLFRNIIVKSSINEYALCFKGLLSMEGVICFLGVKDLRGTRK